MIYKGQQTIKEIIQAAAREENITLTRLAEERLYMKQANFSRMFNNSRMTIEQLQTIAAALGYDIDITLVKRKERTIRNISI